MEKGITIIGSGKVATQIALQLVKSGHSIDGVWGKTKANAITLSNIIHTKQLQTLSEISSNSLALVCVADEAIKEVLKDIPLSVRVAYTSGSIAINDLPKRPSLGVFYPLQTFSPGKQVDISIVPFLIEANTEAFTMELKALASTVSNRVILADSQDRYNTHIAAVMVNNFTNFLYHLAKKHLHKHQLDFDILKPLIAETVNKLETLSPIEAQTGPASRGDQEVINKHIASLEDPEVKILYRLFSELISKEINKK